MERKMMMKIVKSLYLLEELTLCQSQKQWVSIVPSFFQSDWREDSSQVQY